MTCHSSGQRWHTGHVRDMAFLATYHIYDNLKSCLVIYHAAVDSACLPDIADAFSFLGSEMLTTYRIACDLNILHDKLPLA